MSVVNANIYADGTYLANNPTWHEEDAPFKARHIAEIIRANNITFSSIAEIGCGTGGVLRNLRTLTGQAEANWQGFDISAEAIALAQRHADSGGISFRNEDLLKLQENFDVLLIVDVFEHVPDYMGFIEACGRKARYKIYHIPLELHASAAIRDSLTNARKDLGHLHYFSEKTAQATLQDTGHTIIDTMFTAGAVDLFKLHPSVKRAIANVPRLGVSLISTSLSSRLFGGYSLLVLTQ
jgi:SAM-dependent methyltransferase